MAINKNFLEVANPNPSRIKFLYELSPIDFWHGWSHIDQVLKNRARDFTGVEEEKIYLTYIIELIAEALFLAAKYSGWQGDIRGFELYFSGIPTDDSESLIMIGWKQEDNGETFIASPVRLPWLDKYQKYEEKTRPPLQEPLGKR